MVKCRGTPKLHAWCAVRNPLTYDVDSRLRERYTWRHSSQCYPWRAFQLPDQITVIGKHRSNSQNCRLLLAGYANQLHEARIGICQTQPRWRISAGVTA